MPSLDERVDQPERSPELPYRFRRLPVSNLDRVVADSGEELLAVGRVQRSVSSKPWPSQARTSFPVSRFHSFRPPSIPPLTARFPSGEIAMGEWARCAVP